MPDRVLRMTASQTDTMDNSIRQFQSRQDGIMVRGTATVRHIEDNLGRPESIAIAYGNLGLIYRTRGELDKAEEMFRKGLKIDEKIGRLEGMASDYGNLGLIYRTRGELDKAEEMIRKSLKID